MRKDGKLLAKNVILIWEDELLKDVVILCDMRDKTQTEVPAEQVIDKINNIACLY